MEKIAVISDIHGNLEALKTVLNDIEKLIEKYEEGETSLKEEQVLKTYFSQETVASHLEVYKPMFAYFSVNQQEQFTKDIPLTTKKVIKKEAIVMVLGFHWVFSIKTSRV